jgi:hypothetical protein
MSWIAQEDIIGVMLRADLLTEPNVDRSVQVVMRNQADSIRLAKSLNNTIFPFANPKLPPEP